MLFLGLHPLAPRQTTKYFPISSLFVPFTYCACRLKAGSSGYLSNTSHQPKMYTRHHAGSSSNPSEKQIMESALKSKGPARNHTALPNLDVERSVGAIAEIHSVPCEAVVAAVVLTRRVDCEVVVAAVVLSRRVTCQVVPSSHSRNISNRAHS